MLTYVHREVTREALNGRLSPRALEIVVAANIRQDALRYQIGYDQYHFDNNKFDASDRYVHEQRGYVLANLLTPVVAPAWVAFGKLTHTVQDFYSHTNYVSLWHSRYKDSTPPPPPEIDAVDGSLIRSRELCSGKVYYPLEILYFIPGFRRLALSILPRDSHAHMNLDSEKCGPLFAYARVAAVKRTQHELSVLEKLLTPEMFERFVDL